MNQVQLVGRVARSPELRYTGNGKALCFLTLGVDGYFDKSKGEMTTDWIPVQVWGKLGERCAQHLVKGSLVSVVGRLKFGSYEKDGKKVYTLDVVAEEVNFLVKPKQKE